MQLLFNSFAQPHISSPKKTSMLIQGHMKTFCINYNFLNLNVIAGPKIWNTMA